MGKIDWNGGFTKKKKAQIVKWLIEYCSIMDEGERKDELKLALNYLGYKWKPKEKVIVSEPHA